MTNNSAKSLIMAMLAKKAAEQPPADPAEAVHEAGETPQAEALEHAGGAGEGAEAHPEAGGGELEHLISQLSPEELEHLATQISGDMQHPGDQEDMMRHGGEDEVAALAQAIQEHLHQNPEAGLEGTAPEKMAALNFVKSAAYIEGFIKQAIDRGVEVSQAVDLYDSALTQTIDTLRKSASALPGPAAAKASRMFSGKQLAGAGAAAAGLGYAAGKLTSKNEDKEEKKAELKGDQHKLDVNHNGKLDAVDFKMLRNKGKKSDEATKEAAYYEGVLERAREYGFSDSEALAIVKQAVFNR
jgi:hypothetical protein